MDRTQDANLLIQPPLLSRPSSGESDGEALFNPGWKRHGKILVPDSGPTPDVDRAEFSVKVVGFRSVAAKAIIRNEGVE